MPYTTIVLIVCCAVLYYRIGESEYGGGVLLALVSIALWLLGSYLLGFGWFGNLLVQAGLYLALTVCGKRGGASIRPARSQCSRHFVIS